MSETPAARTGLKYILPMSAQTLYTVCYPFKTPSLLLGILSHNSVGRKQNKTGVFRVVF